MPRMPKVKDKFAELDSDWKDAVAQKDPDEIRDMIAQVALNELDNQKMRDEDQDLTEKREAAKYAAEQYKEATKHNKLRISFMKRVLDDKGKN